MAEKKMKTPEKILLIFFFIIWALLLLNILFFILIDDRIIRIANILGIIVNMIFIGIIIKLVTMIRINEFREARWEFEDVKQ